jgi:hypothetical protein
MGQLCFANQDAVIKAALSGDFDDVINYELTEKNVDFVVSALSKCDLGGCLINLLAVNPTALG